jgi:predicted AlkP superfamily pyrophosphatase or phosphodiesterase
MNWKVKLFLSFGLLVFVSLSSFRTYEVKKLANSIFYKTENVIVLVIDGPRFSETFGDSTRKYIPHLANDLAPKGVLLTNFKNNGTTTTVSGHAAITSGVYQNLKNNGLDFPKYPSFFQYYLKEKQFPKDKAWIISSKGKLNILSNAKKKDWKDVYSPMSYCGNKGSGDGYVGDVETWNNVKRIISDYKPNLLLINLLSVDVAGHNNNWEGYLEALKNTDNYAFELWNLIQKDEKYKDKTTLIITNDHGRHLDGHKNGFVNHGDKCEGCKHIYCIGLGPDFQVNKVSNKPYELIDISQTIATLLQFKMPTSKGKLITDFF